MNSMRAHVLRLRDELDKSMVEQAKFICEIESLKEELAGLRFDNEILRGRLEEKELYLSYWRRTAESLKEKKNEVNCTVVIIFFLCLVKTGVDVALMNCCGRL